MGYIIFVFIIVIAQFVFAYLAQAGIVKWQDAIQYYPVIIIGIYIVYFLFWGRNFHKRFNKKYNFNASPFDRIKNIKDSFQKSKNLGATDQEASKQAAKQFFKDNFSSAFQGTQNLENQLKDPAKIRSMISPIANRTTIESNLQQITKIKKVKKSKTTPNSYDLVGIFPDGSKHNFRATLNTKNPPEITGLNRIS